MSTVVSPLDELLGGRSAAIIGGGRMGAAIGHVLASSGVTTFVVEPVAAVRETFADRVAAINRLRRVEASPLLVCEIADIPADVAIVIEAVSENLKLKQDIFRRLEVQCSRDTILATNTSVIPVADIAQGVVNKDRVVGSHFWNPPYTVRLVEVVQAEATSEATVVRTMAIMTAIGQDAVHVKKDIPGFIGNRLQHALKREAIALVQAGVCDAETLDMVVRKSFGARLAVMGPLEQSDMLGLELTLAIHKTILPDLDVTPHPQDLLVALCESGRTGCDVGEGFRTWTPEQAAELRSRLDHLLLDKA